MASRMERYYKDELINSGRSTKNKSLYKQIEDLDNYTNIEGVATIEKTNEIDISKVKELLQNRENYKKQKQFRGILKEEDEVEEPIVDVKEETKNYDINDILSKVKQEEPTVQRNNRSLSDEQYKTLKSLNISRKGRTTPPELKQNEVSNKDYTKTLGLTDDVGLLDELKSNTMVGDASSIKKIIEEEKQNRINDNTSTMEIDKSFFTSSLGFTKSDFEELKDINHKIKKGNKFIIGLLIAIILLLLLSGILFLILK